MTVKQITELLKSFGAEREGFYVAIVTASGDRWEGAPWLPDGRTNTLKMDCGIVAPANRRYTWIDVDAIESITLIELGGAK